MRVLPRNVVYDKQGKTLEEGHEVIVASHRGTVISLGPTFVRVAVGEKRFTRMPHQVQRVGTWLARV